MNKTPTNTNKGGKMKLIKKAYGKRSKYKYRDVTLFKLNKGGGMILLGENGHHWSKEIKKYYKKYSNALKEFNWNTEVIEYTQTQLNSLDVWNT